MPPNPPPPDAVRKELGRLIATEWMRRAPTHARLLRYLVDKRLAGDLPALRETSIALEVFRRDAATYDPATDPIVRVSVSRLRERLSAHYADPAQVGAASRILLPKGSYAPEFVAQETTEAAAPGVAVLRVRNHAGDVAHDVYCDALTDRLIDALARAGVPRVLARASVTAAEADCVEPVDIGRKLGVSWLVETVLNGVDGGRLRLTVRMVKAFDGALAWTETATRGAPDRYALADRVIDATVLRCRETLPGVDGAPSPAAKAGRASTDLRAGVDLVRLLLLRRSLAEADRALAQAEALAVRFPEAAETHAWLAAASYSRMSFDDERGSALLGEARAHATRALELDPDHPVALRTLAIIVGKFDTDFPAAEALYAKALRIAPHYTSARLNFAELLALQGRFDDALAEAGLALVYDPLSPSVRMCRAIVLAYRRDYGEARHEWALCQAAGDDSPWVLAGAANCEACLGNRGAADALADEIVARFPGLPMAWISRAVVKAMHGDAVAARAATAAASQGASVIGHLSLATVAILLGERDEALGILEAALRESRYGVLAASVDPAFEGLRDDPRFRRILQSIGVPGWRGLPSRRA